MNKVSKTISENKILVLIILVATLLRLLWLDRIPISLYIDELDLGYQAYSLLKTGRDYFGNFLPLHPRSFAEFRTPFNIYSAIPSVWLFGINAWGIRLPSVIFGVLGVLSMYLLVYQIGIISLINHKREIKFIALISSATIAFSPWHIQFSRSTLEVSSLFFFLTFGIYLFFKSFKQPKFLSLSTLFLSITPWIYSTAKLFIPFFIIFLLLNWRKKVLKVPRKNLSISTGVLLILALPLMYLTFNGKAGSRFSYISVFSDPVAKTEVNYDREYDATFRGENQLGTKPKLIDKYFHSKLVFWTNGVVNNFIESLSSDFLFFKGDPNLRHSPEGVGEFYWIEIIPFLVGLILFFSKEKDFKVKKFILFWLIAGIVPSALTRDGGNHAPRLILILPPLIFLISYGLFNGLKLFNKKSRKYVITSYITIWAILFSFVAHNYLVHYPWDSERWWDAGYQQMIEGIKKVEGNYEKIVITTADEPPLIFFASYYPYNPKLWQQALINGNLTGESTGVKFINKYYFDQFSYDKISEKINESTLYVASAREVETNFIMEPEKVSKDLKLVMAISYPSGEPAFYFFAKNKM